MQSTVNYWIILHIISFRKDMKTIPNSINFNLCWTKVLNWQRSWRTKPFLTTIFTWEYAIRAIPQIKINLKELVKTSFQCWGKLYKSASTYSLFHNTGTGNKLFYNVSVQTTCKNTQIKLLTSQTIFPQNWPYGNFWTVKNLSAHNSLIG